ncbi:MAG TPA: sigma-70 family RNA polymerase sigma factor [Puia sp.]|jgi:RNA polymerase sigma-70 factor (ECF subfamily)
MRPIGIKDDSELLLRTAQGDESALAEIITKYADHLLNYIYNLTKDRQEAEEIVQDIFLKLWNARDYLTNVKDLKAWLFILSRNKALDVIDKALTLKRRQRRWRLLGNIEEDKAAYEQWMSLIDKAVSELPRQQFNVWTLNKREGRTYEQISSDLGISKETVKSYMKLATASITRFLKERATDLLFIALLIGRKS